MHKSNFCIKIANMRYLGNKESIVEEIYKLLKRKELLNNNFIFCDAFCGSGSVANHLKGYFKKVIINDNLRWAVVYTFGRLNSQRCNFDKLGFDPFEFLNNNNKKKKGFFYRNYSPAESNRMYFIPENAERIDYFREQIENWYKNNCINKDEYCYLLASLIESVSLVSNTAGVYGAFLKKWDSRAIKPINFIKVESENSNCNSIEIYNSKIEDIIQDIECDVLYLDPPYTQNQYGTQYHLLETLILDDNPEISKITGSRSTTPMRSDWSKEYKANILFDRILAKTKAKYIILSYNNDGFLSKGFIEASLKRYGKESTYECIKIPYKKYQNWKSTNKKEHFEYLFFIEKKENKDIVYESPLNYIGSKSKLVKDIKKYLPRNFTTFFDAFGGGCNVGVNIIAKQVRYNEINFFVKDLIESFKINDTYQYIMFLKKTIAKYGLEKANTQAYQKARSDYNALPIEKRDPKLLYALILYGYQQQIRFNNSLDFNNPVGIRWFNDKVLEKMISFSRHIKEINIDFYSDTYKNYKNIDTKTLVYMDPPYMLTTGSYNDGKRGFLGWNKELEKDLFEYADYLTANNVPFILSYVYKHKGNVNTNFKKWIKEQNYNMIQLEETIGISGSKRKEVLITNYEYK